MTPLDSNVAFGGGEFQQPGWLVLLLLIIPLLWWLGRRGPLPSIPVPSLRGIAALGRTPRRHQGVFRFFFLLLPLVLLVAALARPRIPRGDLPDPSKGLDIMLCLDYSRSMAETDFRLKGRRVMRKDALVSVTEEFIAGRPSDRIGIVCFARNPWLVSPLTLDHGWARAALREAEMATGTGIGWAIQASVNFLRKASERSRVVILITDGDNSAGPRPLEIAPLALQEKVKIYTVLIGPEMVTPSAAANHELNRVARLTGGQFFQANDSRALESIYRLIDQLEKRELIQKRFVTWRELFPWFVAAGAGLWMVGLVSTDLTKRRVP